jgi:hypothetical protein
MHLLRAASRSQWKKPAWFCAGFMHEFQIALFCTESRNEVNEIVGGAQRSGTHALNAQ